MADNVNKIKNPDFSLGKLKPRAWTWTARSGQVQWRRESADRDSQPGPVTVVSEVAGGTAEFSQIVVCKPDEYYCIEATVTCEVEAADETAGCVVSVEPVSVEPVSEGQSVGKRLVTPGLHRATAPTAVRTYYQAPDDVRRLRISVGLLEARGTVTIHDVRFIRIIEPDLESHLLAVPPPPWTLDRPRVVGSVCICSNRATERPIRQLLAGYFGERNVKTLAPAKLRTGPAGIDALLLPDPTPPLSVRSLSALMKLAVDRIVVISLPAFATLTRGNVSVRRIEQDDDPIHAKVYHASHVTRGFALQDTFPYAWSGRRVGSFAQNQFRRSVAARLFLERHGFTAPLVSMCDKDATSDRPICLHKPTERGGLFVLDIEPVEAAGSTFGEPVVAMHFLLSVLGQSVAGLGQFIAPEETERGFREAVREMPQRFPPISVHDADVPIEEVTEQLVTIGREDRSFGQPLKPKPVIMVRSGLTSGDVESVYGSLLWFKQLVQIGPCACPYADRLGSRFRLAWIPQAAAWEAREGWRRSRERPDTDMTFEAEDEQMAALIDVVSCPVNRVRVVIPGRRGDYGHTATWLPQLWTAFNGDGCYTYGVEDGAAFTDRTAFAWRRLRHDVRVVVDPDAFPSDAHHDVMAAGGQVIRIEVPGSGADFSANSIHRTDLTATLLEQVIGLQYGMIAVNRLDAAVHFGAFPPVVSGEALIVDGRDPALQVGRSRAG